MPNHYSALLDECAATRVDLDEIHHSRYRELAKRFFQLTGIAAKRFKEACDLRYYRGGYPTEESLPYDEVLVDKVVAQLYLDSVLEGGRLTALFAERGVTFKADFALAFPVATERIGPVKQQANQLAAEALELQGVICRNANSIKIAGAERAKNLIDVSPPPFVKAVGIAARGKRFGAEKMAKAIEKLRAKAAEQERALEPLDDA